MNRQHHREAYHRFRHYSRAILKAPSATAYHRERINIAKQFDESEPLQGALSDYFFGCWYDVPMIHPELILEFEPHLNTQARQIINDCINKKYYLQKNNLLATRWSIITTPTLDVPSHKLRSSSDDASHLAQSLLEAILIAHQAQNHDEVTRLEDEFFNHCLVCLDLAAFMKAWFKLGKHDWVFDMRWIACRTELENHTKKHGL